jgi:predicted enzyme related to lactoylglutathione lyase
VVGIGGVFIRARDPAALARWYTDRLGIETMVIGEHEDVWRPEGGPTVFSPFPDDTDYFGRPDQQVMLNFRVRDLDAMLAQLRAAGADVVERSEEVPGIGRFGWGHDPEQNRFELWEPAKEALDSPPS